MAAGDQCVAFANRGVATIAGAAASAPTVTSFAVMKDLEITVGWDHVPLYGWGTVRRVAVAKHTEKVGVKVGSMKFNPNATAAALPWWSYVSNPTAGGVTDEDTNTVKLFDVTGAFTFEDGQVLKATIYNVYFPSIPFRGSEGQWVKLDASGEGAYVLWAAAI
jgi:hypothetical protein